MILYPNKYVKNVKEITVDFLKEENIKGMILDVDNTLIDFDKNVLEGLDEWAEGMKKNNIKTCILSNTNKVEKVKKVAEILDVKFITFARKPCKAGFKRAMDILKLSEHDIAVIGDQIMTDIIGGNRMGMYTILTEPIDKRDIFITKVKRPLEMLFIRKYLKEMGKK